MIKLGSIKVTSFVTMYFKYHVYAGEVQYFKTSRVNRLLLYFSL